MTLAALEPVFGAEITSAQPLHGGDLSLPVGVYLAA